MTQYTTLTRPEIETILSQFGIANIQHHKILSGGSENTNYLVIAAKGKFVLTICEQKTAEKARDLAHLLTHLEAHHFQTSKIVRTTNDDVITLWQGKPVMVKQFIEGKIIENLPGHLIELIGKELGKLHKIEAPDYLPKELGYGKEQFHKVKEYAPKSPFHDWLQEKLDYLSPYLSPDLPKALIHSDLFADNVIINENESSVMVMDFEEAAYYYRVFDVGMTIIGVCGETKNVNLHKAAHLLKGYQEEIKLLDIEIRALQAFTIYAATAMTFWRHINFNYTKPDPALKNHYLGLKVLADDIAAQSMDTFLQSMKINFFST